MKQLILIEGLPGTGKTTATKRISEHLASKCEKVVTLYEGDERIPCDFYEMAGIPIDEFEAFRTRHLETADELWAISLRTTNYVYLRLDKCSDFIADTFRKWDMGDERNQQVSVAEYMPCVLERLDSWVASNIDSEDIVVIDSGFLQNPINELLFRKASDGEVHSFIKSIIEKFKLLNPVCFYLKRESAEAAISFAKRAKGHDWSSRIDSMLAELACPNLFEHRFELELKLLPSISHIICSIRDEDWSDMDRHIEKIF